ncbi:hypothetical protein BCAH1134_C0625 (plasmid) [Bacillus cereus AH1134]|nr:hypothetical protein BCAH1134_C0625 [Bacillus cereus AH1134]
MILIGHCEIKKREACGQKSFVYPKIYIILVIFAVFNVR